MKQVVIVHPTIVYRKSEHTVAIELHFYDSASISRQRLLHVCFPVFLPAMFSINTYFV